MVNFNWWLIASLIGFSVSLYYWVFHWVRAISIIGLQTKSTIAFRPYAISGVGLFIFGWLLYHCN
jgi:Sec-independent protein secretion pathway component TatC